MEALVLLIFGTLASVLVGIATSEISAQNQRNAAAEADKRQLQNQKDLIDYQLDKQRSFNTIATEKGFATDAGVNPALLFDSLPQIANISGGTAQGTAPDLSHFADIGKRLDPTSLMEASFTNRQMDLNDRQVRAQEQASKGAFMRDMSQAMENMRNTKFQKTMEKVIYDRSMAELDLMKSQKQGIDISNIRAQLMLPGELEHQGLINQQTVTQIQDTVERMKNYPVERAKMRADMKFINSQIERNNHLNALTDEDVKETQERIRNTQVERVMKEHGLTSRSFRGPGNMVDKANMLLKDGRYVGSVAQLVALGFTQEEAVQTTLYYVASDRKDASPSLINAVSRGLSAVILKK